MSVSESPTPTQTLSIVEKVKKVGKWVTLEQGIVNVAHNIIYGLLEQPHQTIVDKSEDEDSIIETVIIHPEEPYRVKWGKHTVMYGVIEHTIRVDTECGEMLTITLYGIKRKLAKIMIMDYGAEGRQLVFEDACGLYVSVWSKRPFKDIMKEICEAFH